MDIEEVNALGTEVELYLLSLRFCYGELIRRAISIEELEKLRVELLGRNGIITSLEKAWGEGVRNGRRSSQQVC